VTSSFEFDSEIVSSVTIDGELAAVGVNSYGVLDLAGAVQTYRQLDDKWVEMPPLVAPSPRANEFFGASIDISGDRLAVGAPATNERFFGYPNWFKGSVYMYRFRENAWELESVIKDSSSIDSAVNGYFDLDILDGFGFSVALDEDFLVVGAHLKSLVSTETSSYAKRSGSTLVYQNVGSGWDYVTEYNDRPIPGGYGGMYVGIDDGTVLTGLFKENTKEAPSPIGDNSNLGSAHIFTLDLNAGNDLDRYGRPNDQDRDGVPDISDSDLDGDGIENDADAFVSNPDLYSDTDSDGIDDRYDADNDNDGLNDEFEVKFGLDPTSSEDSVEDTDLDGFSNLSEYLAASDPSDVTSLPQSFHSALVPDYLRQEQDFGQSLAIDGGFAVVGAPNDPGSNGSAYFYIRESDHLWALKEVILPDVSHRRGGLSFGYDVAINSRFIAVSWPGYGLDRGSVWIYEIRVDGAVLHQVLTGHSDYLKFGYKVSFANDTLIVASPEGRSVTGGEVTTYELSENDRWTEKGRINSISGEFIGRFGAEFAFNDGTLLIGEPGVLSGRGRATFFSYDTEEERWIDNLSITGDVSGEGLGKNIALNSEWAAVGVNSSIALYRNGQNGWLFYEKLTESNSVQTFEIGCAECRLVMADGFLFVEIDQTVSAYQFDGKTWVKVGSPPVGGVSNFEADRGLLFMTASGTNRHELADNVVRIVPYDGDLDGESTFRDPDDTDPTIITDFDNDGLSDFVDPDDDNDDVNDSEDAFPLNPFEFTDSDGDGLGNNIDLDDDNDGVVDWMDAYPFIPLSEFSSFSNNDRDGDGRPDYCRGCPEEDLDDDNDGIPDVSDDAPGRSLSPRERPVQVGADIPHSGFLSMSARGDVIAIGSKDEQGQLGAEQGAVRVFRWSDDRWNQIGKTIVGEQVGAKAGSAIALSNDGQLLAVGFENFQTSNSENGIARVYRLVEGDWVQQGEDIDPVADYHATQLDMESDPSVYIADQIGFGKTIAFDDSANLLVIGNGSISVTYIYAEATWGLAGSKTDAIVSHEDGPDVRVMSDRMVVGQGLSWFGHSYPWGSYDPSVWFCCGWNRLTPLEALPTQLTGDVLSFDLAYLTYAHDPSASRDQDQVFVAIGSEGQAQVYRRPWGRAWTPTKTRVYGEQYTNGVPWLYGAGIALNREGEFAVLTGHGYTPEGENSKIGRVDVVNQFTERVVASVFGESDDQLGFPASARPIEFNWLGDVFAAQTKAGATRVFALEPRDDWVDSDQDGLPDECDEACLDYGLIADTDDDNDGILDANDTYPLIPINGLLDTDRDGAPNDCDEACLDTGMEADSDDDGDGVEDTLDVFPLDATETLDTDGDGVGNNADTDDDGDGILDDEDAFPLDATESADTDGDGVGNNADSDDDGDGVEDTLDVFPLDATETLDTDGDGVGNNADTDDDGDGILDDEDAFPLDATESADTDGDGVGNNADSDDDGDGVEDTLDVFPLDATETLDTDGDGVGNNADTDDDGDGILDDEDAFPLDATESADTDGDGVGNNADSDDDGDGVEDTLDVFPLDATETLDTDGDGVGNNADTDDDGDGFSDEEELEAGTDSLNSESFPSNDEEGSGGLPIWMLYIATQPKAA
jgi:hypothetical protein